MLAAISAIMVLTGPDSTDDAPHVMAVKELLSSISAETKQVWSASPDLKALPVFVVRNDAPVQSVIEGLRFALRASVEKSKGGFVLTRTTADRAMMLSDARACWKARISNWLVACHRHEREAAVFGSRSEQIAHYRSLVGEQLKRMRALGDSAPVLATVDPSELSPLGVLYRKIIERIGVDQLCALAPEERRLWSSRPESGQIACPDGEALLGEYERQTSPGTLSTSGPVSTAARFTFMQVGGSGFRLVVYDERGNIQGRYGGPPFAFAMAGPILVSPGMLAAPYGEKPDAWLPLSPYATACEPFLGHHRSSNKGSTQNLPLAIRRPDQVDPLDLNVRFGLVAMANEAKCRSFVASLGDGLFEAGESCVRDGRLNVSGLSHVLQSNCGYEVLSRGALTVYRPLDAFSAERYTADREQVAGAVRELLSVERIGTRDLGKAYYSIFPHENSQVARSVFDLVASMRPHYQTTAIHMASEALAMIGAAFAAEGDADTVTIDPGSEPFTLMVDRGVSDGWLKFESAKPVPAAKLDPAAIVASNSYAPWLQISREARPAMAMLGVSHSGSSDPYDQGYGPLERIASMYAGFVSQLPMLMNPGQPDKLPSRDEVAQKVRKFGNYDLGTTTRLTLDLYANRQFRARLFVDETAVDKVNVTWDDLDDGLKGRLLDATMAAMNDIVKAAANPKPPATPDARPSRVPPS